MRDAQNDGKPRAVPEAFRSNPPIKSVNGTYAGALLLRNFQMRSGPRIWPGVALEPLLESTRQRASRTTKTASQARREPYRSCGLDSAPQTKALAMSANATVQASGLRGM